ncbi:MAG: tRNA threonylcarbamoyladenosine dehydratase [Clostridia bacterium]|nr:tRNA threonylcarbamoyladenosine dehydratase [Clostridia bacterium]
MFSRTVALIGAEGLEKLHKAHVAVFGVGGVGGYVVEALARSGVGELTLVDNDRVSLSNLNRQIIALHSTLGRRKVEVAAERARDINPDITVHGVPLFVLPESVDELDFSPFDYVVDAIDTVSGKLAIIERARAQGVPVISAMGAGNKLDPAKFEVADIEKTSVCPLARVMRRELKKRGVKGVKVVYSKEEAIVPERAEKTASGKPIAGSISFVPSVAGLILAGEVIKDLIKE